MNRILCGIGLVYLGFTLSGCGTAPPDPLEKFKEVVKSVESRKPVKYCTNWKSGDGISRKDGIWSRVEKHVAGVSFDVKKTDSLVSPFEGVIVVEVERVHFVADPGGREVFGYRR